MAKITPPKGRVTVRWRGKRFNWTDKVWRAKVVITNLDGVGRMKPGAICVLSPNSTVSVYSI